MFSLICVWINDWVNNREAGDLRRYRAHYDVIVMFLTILMLKPDYCGRSRFITTPADPQPWYHDDVIKWKHFPRYWPFMRGIHRSPVNSPHKGQWRGALMFSLICTWINSWVNNREAGYLRRHRAHYDVIVMVVVQDKGTTGYHISFTLRHLPWDWNMKEITSYQNKFSITIVIKICSCYNSTHCCW